MPECHRLCTISRQFSRSSPRRHSVLRPCTAEYSEILLNSAVGPCLPWTYTSVKISAWWTSFEGTQRVRFWMAAACQAPLGTASETDTAIGNITTANKRHAVLCKLEWALIRQADRQTDRQTDRRYMTRSSLLGVVHSSTSAAQRESDSISDKRSPEGTGMHSSRILPAETRCMSGFVDIWRHYDSY